MFNKKGIETSMLVIIILVIMFGLIITYLVARTLSSMKLI